MWLCLPSLALKGLIKSGRDVRHLAALPWCYGSLFYQKGIEIAVQNRFSWLNTVIPQPTVSQPYVFSPNYWVDKREKQEKSFPSPVCD